MVSSGQIHLWLTLGYGLAVPVIAVMYWRAYGPTNFLWLSDIALAFTLVALLAGNRLLASMAARFGYDQRALIYQTLLTWVVLIITYVATDPDKNINWVFGPGNKPQQLLHPLLYLGLEMAVIPVCVFLPTHWLLKRFF